MDNAQMSEQGPARGRESMNPWIAATAATLLLAVLFSHIVSHVISHKRKLRIHHSRSRVIYGCLLCGRELYPGEERYTCTECSEPNYDYCHACYHSRRNRHKHRMVKERIRLEVDTTPIKKAASVGQMMMVAFDLYKSRPLLGFRPRLDKSNFAHYFEWMSYGQVRDSAIKLSRNLRLMGVEQDDFVCFLGASSVPWFLFNYAFLMMAQRFVPIHASASKEHIMHIFSTVRPRCVVASIHLRPILKGVIRTIYDEAPINILIFYEDLETCYYRSLGRESGEEKQYFPEAVRILSLQDVLNAGKRSFGRRLKI